MRPVKGHGSSPSCDPSRQTAHGLRGNLREAQIHSMSLAQFLRPLLRGARVRAWASDEVNRQAEIPQYLYRPECAQRIGGGENERWMTAPAFEALQEYRYVRAEEIAATFHDDGIGGDR